MKAVIYTRISRDDKGDEAGVKRQEQDCRKWCADNGYDVVEVYCDNDISAMGLKYRPSYRRMLAGIKAHAFEAVVTWHQDRITRSPYEMEEYIDTCGVNKNGLPTYTLNGGPLNLTTPEGRLQARFGVIIAQYYVEHNAANARRAKVQSRARGQYHAGARCPRFGYRRVDAHHIEIIPEHAPIIRQMHEDFQGGKSLTKIANWLNDLGYDTMFKRPFNESKVRTILRCATYAGYGEYFSKEEHNWGANATNFGQLYEGQWEPIVEYDVWRKTADMLMDKRRAHRDNATSATLLAGDLMTCGVCGHNLTTRK